MADPSPIDVAKGNGYTDDQINDFLAPRIAAAKASGYTDDQINQYLGIKPPEPFDGTAVRQMGSAALAAAPTPVSGFEDALKAGWGMSVTGLASKAPTQTLDENAPASSRMAFNLAQMAGDIPAYLGGALIGGGVGAETGPGAVITAGAGAMALPTALRGLMMDSYAKGQFNNFGDFWDRVAPIMADTAKSYITGGATAGAGVAAGAALPEAGLLRGAGVTAAELATMVTVGKGLEGEMPRARDFGDAAVMLGGMKFGEFGAAKLRDIFTRTGVTPSRVVADAASDVTVQQDLLSERETPRRYEPFMEPGGNAPFPGGEPIEPSAPGPVPERILEPTQPEVVTPGATPIQPESAEPQRLLSFLVQSGGIRDPGGDVSATIGGPRGRPGLISANGRNLDDAALNAWQAGYFPNHSERPSINDLLQAIDEDYRGNPQYSHHDEAAVQNYQATRAQNGEVLRLASELGLPTQNITREQFFDAVHQHLTPEDFDARVSAEEDRHQQLYDEAERQAAAWQHQTTEATVPKLEDRPMWFSERGHDFYSSSGVAENGLPIASTHAAQLDFRNPFVESKATPEVWSELGERIRANGATEEEAATFLRDKEHEFGAYMPPWFVRSLEDMGYDGVIADKSWRSRWAIALHPREQVRFETPEGFDAAEFYGHDQHRSLEDLENEYRQENAAVAARERAGGGQPGGPASPDQTGVPAGGEPGRGGAGPTGREEPPPAGTSAIPTVGPRARQPEPERPDVNPWAAGPTEAGASPFVNPWEAGPEPEIPLEGGGGGGAPPPQPPGGQGELPLPPSPMTPEGARSSILSHLSIGESAPGRPWTFARIYTDLFNRFFPIEQAVARVAGRNVLPAIDDAGKLARMMAGSTGIADRFSNYNTLDFGTRRPNGEGLKPILDRIADLDGFRAYIAAEHALELEAQGVRTGFDLDAARHVIANGAAEFAEPAQALYAYSNRLAAYLRDSGVLSQAGYDEMTQKWLAYVPFQRVMEQTAGGDVRQRVSSSLQARQVIHGIEGSQRVVIDPIESIVRNTYLYTHMAERNVVGTKLIDLLRPFDEAEVQAAQTAAARQGLDAIAPLANAGQPPKPDEIRIFRDGRAETYRVDPEIAVAMKGLDVPNMGILERMMRPFAQVLRAGAVLNPDFMLRHSIRDYLYATVTHPNGFTPQMMLKGFMSEIGHDADYQDWLSSGGANVSMISLDRGYLQMTLDELTDTGLTQRAWNVVADPSAAPLTRAAAAAKLPVQAFRQFVMSPLQFGVNLVESATHLGTFIDAKKQMLAQMPAGAELSKEQLLEAGYLSRDVAVDAARMGSQVRVYNAIKAFANIALQDTDRVARAFLDRPMTTALKVAGAVVLPSVLVWNNGKDDPRYEDAPLWERDLFWVIPTDRWVPATQQETIGQPQYLVRSVDGQLGINRGATWRIPKPWGMGLIFGSGTERILDGFTKRDPGFARDFGKSMGEVAVPIGFPDAMVPIVEQIANRSLFSNRTLVPSEMESNLPEYQYTPYTTETAKALGAMFGAFPGISSLKTNDGPLGGTARALSSPMLLENYLRGWTGNLGLYALQVADLGLRKTGALPDPVEPAATLADIPVVKAFAVRYPGTGAESIQQFEDAYDANKTAFDTWRRMASEGNAAALDRIRRTEAPPVAAAQMTPENAAIIGLGKAPLPLDVDAEARLTAPVLRNAAGTLTEAALSAARAQATGSRIDTNMPITLQQMADIRSVLTEHSQLVRDIYKNNDIPPDEKRQLIDTVYYRMQELAQIGMAGVRRAEAASVGTTVPPAYRTIPALQ
jgi:Large polyvalent protein associated domain 38